MRVNILRGLVPRTRSSHHNCRESGCELRVQSGTRIKEVASVLRFRSSLRNVRLTRANFGIGTLALLVALWIGALSQPAAAQSMGMDAMLKQTGYDYKTHNATTWSIDLNRKHLG